MAEFCAQYLHSCWWAGLALQHRGRLHKDGWGSKDAIPLICSSTKWFVGSLCCQKEVGTVLPVIRLLTELWEKHAPYFVLLSLSFTSVFCMEEACFFPFLLWDTVCLVTLSETYSLWPKCYQLGLRVFSSMSVLPSHVSVLCSTLSCQKTPCNVFFYPLILIWHCSGHGRCKYKRSGKARPKPWRRKQSSIKLLFPSHWLWTRTKNKASFHLMSRYWWKMHFLADTTQAFKSLNVFQVEGPVLPGG